jgi:hypothetical protein
VEIISVYRQQDEEAYRAQDCTHNQPAKRIPPPATGGIRRDSGKDKVERQPDYDEQLEGHRLTRILRSEERRTV